MAYWPRCGGARIVLKVSHGGKQAARSGANVVRKVGTSQYPSNMRRTGVIRDYFQQFTGGVLIG